MLLATRGHGFDGLFEPGLPGWRMAGRGGFADTGDAVETYGGPGLLWYAARRYTDFALHVAWRIAKPGDNSGVFIRIPPLRDSPQPAIEHGYEVQIDDRGIDPERGLCGSALHLSGAIYGLAPARRTASRPTGSWNEFDIVARGPVIRVRLNGALTAATDCAARRRTGHIALQAHHTGSVVQFRDLRVQCLAGRSAGAHRPALVEE